MLLDDLREDNLEGKTEAGLLEVLLEHEGLLLSLSHLLRVVVLLLHFTFKLLLKLIKITMGSSRSVISPGERLGFSSKLWLLKCRPPLI